METFSTGDLARTLFAPFRQTYAGQIKGPLGVQIRAFFDRLISRVIGFIVRMVLISMSLVAMLVVLLTAIIGLVVWPLIPLLPLLSFLFMGMRLGA
jgi:hypothetical protein